VGDEEKPLFWVASCKKDLRAFPVEVQDVMGYALDLAQRGGKHSDAKPLKGYKSSGVLGSSTIMTATPIAPFTP
jgi:phage-related protein